MELGICVRDIPAAELADLGRFAEDHGYSEIYVPDTGRGAQTLADGRLTGRDAFVNLATMFASTSSVRGGLGVAAVPMHHAKSLAMMASTLTEASGGRFSLGIGVSHAEQTAQHGVEFPPRPISYMQRWLAELRAYSSDGVAFGEGWPVLLAALGPRMVELGATHADGLVLNWLTPNHTAATIDSIRAAAPEPATPRTVLYLRLMSAEATRTDAINYDAMANYHGHFLNQGLGDIDAIIAGTTLPLEDLDAAQERIEEYRASDLDLLCLYPHGLDTAERNAALAALTT
jgi:alkanesulfonate monooxygenase SsuD/methylene tetrahydromethanopterin reductase-like flavin-dependent oxidoreductase (luciferase family)